MLYKTQGIIIKKTDLAETNRLLTIYTRDFGKIRVLARAVKKEQAKLKGHLELFLHSRLMLAPGRNLDIITGAETIESFPQLHQRLSSLAAAYYLAEIIDKIMAGPEKDERIWNLLLSSFQELDITIKTKTVQNFENKLLEFLGYDLTNQINRQNPVSFIQSLIGEKICAKEFLEKIKLLY